MYKSKYLELLTQCVQKWEGPLDPCAHDNPRTRTHHIQKYIGEQSRIVQVRVDDADLVSLVW